MSSNCDVNKSYNLTKTDGLPKTCSVNQKEEILLKALDNSDADQRYAAVLRLTEQDKITPRIKEKTLKIFAQEKDQDVLSALAKFFLIHQMKKAVPQLLKKINNPSAFHTYIPALEKLGDHTAIPALQEVFKKSPSKTIAELLLKLGDPYLGGKDQRGGRFSLYGQTRRY